MEKQLVAFKVNENSYCIDIMEVQEVIRENNVTHMPDFPSFVEGVINLRGVIIPIVSIHKKLYATIPQTNNSSEELFFNPSIEQVNQNIQLENIDLQNKGLKNGESYKLLVIKVGIITIGLLVDSLDKILVAKDVDVQSAEGLGRSINHKMVSGLLHAEDAIYIVLNSQGVLESSEEKMLNLRLQ